MTDESTHDDEMYAAAVKLVVETQFGSVSMIQRKLRIGYSRALKLMDRMIADGIVAQGDGSTRAREVLKRPDELAALQGEIANVPLDGLDVDDQPVPDDEIDQAVDGESTDDEETSEADRARMGMAQLDVDAEFVRILRASRSNIVVSVHASTLDFGRSLGSLFQPMPRRHDYHLHYGFDRGVVETPAGASLAVAA